MSNRDPYSDSIWLGSARVKLRLGLEIRLRHHQKGDLGIFRKNSRVICYQSYFVEMGL